MARRRVEHIYDLFDNIVVMFSGGKDSMTTLELVRERAVALDRLPVDVVFLDEEIIPSPVIDTLNRYRAEPWLRLHWFAVPMKNQKYVLGTIEDVVMWDWRRPHVREKPSWAITHTDPHKVFKQQEMDSFVAERVGLKGKIANVCGIRAAESLIRFRSCVNKLNENYIVKSTDKRIAICKPIYDWSENDIFKFLHEQGLPTCEIYRAQWLAQDRLRVATPLHAEARRQHKIATWDPEFVDRIRAVFPDYDTQLRYEKQSDVLARIEPYVERGVEGAEAFIVDTIKHPTQFSNAMKQFKAFKSLHKSDPLAYSVRTFLRQIANGVVRKIVMQDNVNAKPHR